MRFHASALHDCFSIDSVVLLILFCGPLAFLRKKIKGASESGRPGFRWISAECGGGLSRGGLTNGNLRPPTIAV